MRVPPVPSSDAFRVPEAMRPLILRPPGTAERERRAPAWRDREPSSYCETARKRFPTFSAEEMEARVSRSFAEHMAEESIDAALLSSIHNINYFADFVYCSFGRNYGLVVTPERHVTISANIDYGQPWRQSFG